MEQSASAIERARKILRAWGLCMCKQPSCAMCTKSIGTSAKRLAA